MPQDWNLPTVGSGLPAVAEMNYRRQLNDQNLALEGRRTTAIETENARRGEVLDLEKQGIQQKQDLMKQYGELQMVKAMPPDQQEEWVNKIKEKDTEGKFRNVPTKDLLIGMDRYLSAQLGLKQEAGQLYKTQEGYQPADQAIGKMPYNEPPSYAPPGPNRDIETARWYQNATPEQRAAYDATNPRNAQRPQVVQGQYGDPPYEIVGPPGQATARQLVPPGGTPQAAPGTPLAPPKVGEVRKGYRFKGGDPSKQENWVKTSGGATGSY